MGRAVDYGVRAVRADGTLHLPGGICARIVPGGASAIPFPVIGYFDDGVNTPVVFMDTGATPLITEKVDEHRYFPVVVLTGLTPGLSIAYLVAKTMDAAKLIAAGGLQIASDSSGRIVVVGPAAEGASAIGSPVRAGGWDGVNIRTLLTDTGGRLIPADAVRSSYEADVALLAAGGNIVLVRGANKIVRVRRVRMVWPGKQTAAARLTMAFGRSVYTSGGSAGANIAIRKRDTADGAQDASILSAAVVSGADTPYNWFFVCPAADAPFTPFEERFAEDPLSKAFVLRAANDTFHVQAPAFGAGYDGAAILRILWTEE